MKPKILFYLFFIMLLSISNSCEKDPEITFCSKGFVSVDFEYISLPNVKDSDYEIIINDDSTYQNTFQSYNIALPEIDFSKKTLLGKYTPPTPPLKANTFNQQYHFNRRLCINNTEKRYKYTITFIPSIRDDNHGIVAHWICVSKIPKGYIVEFEVII